MDKSELSNLIKKAEVEIDAMEKAYNLSPNRTLEKKIYDRKAMLNGLKKFYREMEYNEV